MGACASKAKKHRRRRRPKADINPYVLEDRNSVVYEDVEYNDTESLTTSLDDPPIHGTEQHNNRNDGNFARSATCISRDSALGDDSFNSRLSSFISLTRHAVTDQSDYSDHTVLCRNLKKSTRHTRKPDLDISTSEDSIDCTYRSRPRRVSIVLPTSDLDAECSAKKEMPTEAIPYMIDVFMPLLLGSIRVLEIIPHLHFIDDTDAFRNKDRENHREAVMMLIERIKASKEPGKWHTFLEALSSGGYTHIYDLLKGHTENDLTIQRKLLRLFTPRLVKRIEPREFLDHLYEKHVISESDMEEIRCEERNRGPIAASLMLLESLPRKNPDWYEIFVDVLKKCGLEDMVDDFDIPGNPDTCSCGSKPQATSIQRVPPPLQLIPPVQPATPAARYTDTGPTRTRQTAELMGYVTSVEQERSYLTPTNDYLPMLQDEQQRTSGQTFRPSGRPVPKMVVCGGSNPQSDKLNEGDEDDDHHYMTLYVNESTEIARLQEEKEKVKRKVEETKLKNKLKREIRQFNKELVALQNADLSEESDSEDNTELPAKHSDAAVAPEIARPELQTDTPVLTNSETQTTETFNTNSNILYELEALKLNMLVLNERITTLSQNTRADGMTDMYFPIDHTMSTPLPIYSSKLREKNAPLPHLNSMEDSGVFSVSSKQYLSI